MSKSVSLSEPAIRKTVAAEWLPLPDELHDRRPTDKLVYAGLTEYQECSAQHLLDELAISTGVVYETLHRLEDVGLIASRPSKDHESIGPDEDYWRPAYVEVSLPDLRTDPTWGDSDV